MIHFVRKIYSFVLNVRLRILTKYDTKKEQTFVDLSSIPMRDTKKRGYLSKSDFKVASKARNTLPILGTNDNYQDKFQDRNLCSRR